MTAGSRSLPCEVPHLAIFITLSSPFFISAQDVSNPSQSTDLTKMNIENLMNVEVTSVSRRQQSLSQRAAAVFVITQDDVQRSGATNIPDVLRMVPGVYVAQSTAMAGPSRFAE